MREDDEWERIRYVRVTKPGPLFGMLGEVRRLFGGSNAFDSTRVYEVFVYDTRAWNILLSENEIEERNCA